MRRPVVPTLVATGVAGSTAGSWTGDFLLVAAGIAVATLGLAVALLLRARDHGDYVRGAAAFAEDVDRRLAVRRPGLDASRVPAAAVWAWTAWGVLVMLCSTAFIGLGADAGAGGAEAWLGLAALLLWCAMLLARLARAWGSWRRVALGVQALFLAILAVAPSDWATELAVAAPLGYAAWALSSARRRGRGRGAPRSGPPGSAVPRPAGT